jgi:ankyrin repeat protein
MNETNRLSTITMKIIVTLLITTIFSMLVLTGNVNIMAQSSQNMEVSNNIIDAVNNIDIVSLNILLAGGADIETTDENGNTPLMLASKIGNLRMVRIIMAHSPDIDTRNKMSETALMIAAEHGQTEIVAILMQNGASIFAQNQSGFTPAELAKRNGHSQIVNLLRDPNETPLSI